MQSQNVRQWTIKAVRVSCRNIKNNIIIVQTKEKGNLGSVEKTKNKMLYAGVKGRRKGLLGLLKKKNEMNQKQQYLELHLLQELGGTASLKIKRKLKYKY